MVYKNWALLLFVLSISESLSYDNNETGRDSNNREAVDMILKVLWHFPARGIRDISLQFFLENIWFAEEWLMAGACQLLLGVEGRKHLRE